MTITIEKPFTDLVDVIEKQPQVVIGPVEQALRDALSRLNEGQNWIKGEYRMGDNYCSVGAVFDYRVYEITDAEGLVGTTARSPIEWGSAEQNTATVGYKYLLEAMPEGRPSLVHMYNDHPATTWADIKAMFTKAIEAAHADGV